MISYFYFRMLSHQEIQTIQRTLAKNPTGPVKRKLQNKLTEHEYASKYSPFSPYVHHREFLNKKTDEKVLHQIINIAKDSEIILLDTESLTVYRQQNRPGLIQLQLLPPDTVPTVIIVEVHHLPPDHNNEFKLMQEFFRIVLDSNKVIYTWGTIAELEPFVEFNLFDLKKIYLPTNEDLQEFFKKYWQQCHQHQDTGNCECEECIGKKPDQSWKLLDAIAYQLHEWLDKRHTCSPFNIGLDPRLALQDTTQLEYRATLVNYAANDVLAMEKLIISMQERPPSIKLTKEPTKRTEDTPDVQGEASIDTMEGSPVMLLLNTSSPASTLQQHPGPDEQVVQQQRLEQNNRDEQLDEVQQTEIRDEPEETNHYQYQQTRIHRSDGQHRNDYQHQRSRFHQPSGQHRNEYQRNQTQNRSIENDADIERKRKNHESTIRQRRRHYKYEIIRRGIDPRFSITIVKEILRRYGVPHTAVNISKSKITGRKSLYIGIRDSFKLRSYERRTRTLFTTEYYNEFCARNHIRHRY